jgi:hypothetical protein
MRAFPLLVPLLALACASARSAAAPASAGSAATGPRPLAPLVSQRLAVLPVQRLRAGDSLGWGATLPDVRSYLASVDDEIAYALKERDVGTGWAPAAQMVRSAQANAAYATDPHALAVDALLSGRRQSDAPLAEPLASQLRTLVALADARFALLPVELRFEPATQGTARAVLRMAIVDARLAQLRWVGEVGGDPSATLSSAVAASVAARVADLFAAR